MKLFPKPYRSWALSIGIIVLLSCPKANAQSTEIQQLLLNMEKLTQLKNILSDMKKGYQLVSNGYNTVRDVTQGNFQLHEVFLDGLYLVKPEVRKYHRIADIIEDQKAIVKSYKLTWGQIKSSPGLSAQELRYAGRVYAQLLKESLDDLDQLALVITSSKLRMADSERLAAIDRIFGDTSAKLSFIRDFNGRIRLLSRQRHAKILDLAHTQNLFKTQTP